MSTDAGLLDLNIRRGDTFVYTLQFNDDAVPPQPIDLSAYTFKSQIRKPNADDLILEFVIDDSDANVGTIVLSAPASVTALLVVNQYSWDFQDTSGGGVTTLLAGTARVIKDTTHA